MRIVVHRQILHTTGRSALLYEPFNSINVDIRRDAEKNHLSRLAIVRNSSRIIEHPTLVN